MSVDPTINAALLNMCARVRESGNSATEGPQLSSTPALAPANSTTTTASSAPASSVAPARPASDYEWLRQALASVESPEKRVKQLLFQMEGKTADGKADVADVEDRVEALEELSDMVEDVNWAAEFALMEGPQRVLKALQQERTAHPLAAIHDATLAAATAKEQEEKEKVVVTAVSGAANMTFTSLPIYTQLAMTVAHSAQLNEPVQAIYRAAHWEEILLQLLHDAVNAVQAVWGSVSHHSSGESEAEEEEETVKAVTTCTMLMRLLAALLHACSCLCRECPLNTIQFIQHGGLAVLADVLKLTRLTTAASSSTSASAGVSVSVTTIHGCASHAGDAPQCSEEDGGVDYAAFVDGANKVTSRIFFFAAYLASTGVSSEDIIRLTCLHAEENDDETVQKAAARELLELETKSPKAIKEAVHAYMPKRFNEWKLQLQRTVGDADEHGGHKDERQQFVEALDLSN